MAKPYNKGSRELDDLVKFLKNSTRQFPADESSIEFRNFVEKFGTLYARALLDGDDPDDDIYLISVAVVPLHQAFDPSKKINELNSLLDQARLSEMNGFDSLCRYFALGANFMCPGWSIDAWMKFVRCPLQHKYGGRRVRIKKRPAAAARQAAKTMTPRQLMEEFGISRSYAYRLVKEKKSTFFP